MENRKNFDLQSPDLADETPRRACFGCRGIGVIWFEITTTGLKFGEARPLVGGWLLRVCSVVVFGAGTLAASATVRTAIGMWLLVAVEVFVLHWDRHFQDFSKHFSGRSIAVDAVNDGRIVLF